VPMNAYSSLCGMVGLSMGQLGNFEEDIIFFKKDLSFQTDSGVVISLSVYHVGLSMVHCRIRVSE